MSSDFCEVLLSMWYLAFSSGGHMIKIWPHGAQWIGAQWLTLIVIHYAQINGFFFLYIFSTFGFDYSMLTMQIKVSYLFFYTYFNSFKNISHTTWHLLSFVQG